MNTNENSLWWVDAETLDYMDNVCSVQATNRKLVLEFESTGKAISCYNNMLSNVADSDWYMVQPTNNYVIVELYRPTLRQDNIDVQIMEVIKDSDNNCSDYKYKVAGLFTMTVTNFNDGNFNNGVLSDFAMLDRSHLWAVECGIFFWNEILPTIAKNVRMEDSQLMYGMAQYDVLEKLHYEG